MKSVLQMLWSFADRWRPGDGVRFVWPSVETIAARLGRKVRGVYLNLATLEREGWIVRDRDNRGRKGWTLNPVAVPPVDPEMQLGFAWDDGPPPEPANESGSSSDREQIASPPPAPVRCAEPVERVDRSAIADVADCNSERPGVQSPKRSEDPVKSPSTPQDTAGQDSLRVFHATEQYRVAKLGEEIGGPARRLPPPGILALWREIGGNAKAWKLVEAYGRRAIDLAADARAKGRDNAEQMVRWRSDGGEWSSARYKAVMAWQGSAAEVPRPSAPPPPRPIVDGVEVDRFELEVHAEGGDDAVRKHRAQVLSHDAIGTAAAGFLAKLRGCA